MGINAFIHGVRLSNSSNSTISGNNMINNVRGIRVSGSSSNVISGNTITGGDDYCIKLADSSSNTISGNNITDTNRGIWLVDSSNHNTVSENNITDHYDGIIFTDSSNNNISGNIITANWDWGIWLSGSLSNVISGNNITNNNGNGVGLYGSSGNSISENNIVSNHDSIRLYNSSSNIIYHNNFVDNSEQVHSESSTNVWDDGYPSGGNYWSNYAGVDEYSGVNQNEPGRDGIGDEPHIIDENNRDNYPFMSPWPQPPWFPLSYFVYNPPAPVIGETVTFNASSSYDFDGNITSYFWEFGDGTNSTEADPIVTHVYTTAGTYTVMLTVTDNDGLTDTTTKPITIGKKHTFISISTSSSSTFVGFRINITGTLRDAYGNGLRNETVVLYYTFSGIGTWTPITSDTTDDLGNYRAMWIPSATGYFVIKAEWTGNTTHLGAHNTTTLSSLVYNNQYVFSVESNSTISGLAFNTTDLTLSFTATGPNGTRGYVKVTVAKSLVANITNIRVYLDGNQTEYSITSTDDSWLLTFNYIHSTHQVVVDLDINVIPEFPSAIILPLFMFLAIIAVALAKKIRLAT